MPTGPWDGAWRLNLPAPPPHSPPDVDEAAHAAGPGGAVESSLTAPMPGTVIRVLAQKGDQVAHAPAAARPRGDEDGDAARLAVRRHGQGRPRRRRATASPAAQLLVELEE